MQAVHTSCAPLTSVDYNCRYLGKVCFIDGKVTPDLSISSITSGLQSRRTSVTGTASPKATLEMIP